MRVARHRPKPNWSLLRTRLTIRLEDMTFMEKQRPIH